MLSFLKYQGLNSQFRTCQEGIYSAETAQRLSSKISLHERKNKLGIIIYYVYFNHIDYLTQT